MDGEDIESVGEQLYNLIYPKHKESAGKLTGKGPVLFRAIINRCSP